MYQGRNEKAILVQKIILTILLITCIAIAIILCTQIFKNELTVKADYIQKESQIFSQIQENNKKEIEKIQVIIGKDEKIEEKENNQTNTTKNKSTKVKNVKSKGRTYETIAYLKIPSLGIEYPVLSKTSTELLKISLNKYWGANPNEVGNMCIVGHNYEDSRFFGKLHKIKKGATVEITDKTGRTLKYKVYKT